jgi:hypothetical protein
MRARIARLAWRVDYVGGKRSWSVVLRSRLAAELPKAALADALSLLLPARREPVYRTFSVIFMGAWIVQTILYVPPRVSFFS